MILSAASLSNPDYVPQPSQIYLLTVSLLILNSIIASLHTRFLARFNLVGATFNLLSLIAFFVVIPTASISIPKTQPSNKVWKTFTNGTEWPDGLAFLMSFLGVIWVLAGYDSPFHLSEECANANVASPRAIVMTSSLGGIIGLFILLVIAYTSTDINGILASPVGQPMGSYLFQTLGQTGGLGMFSLIIICCYFMTQASMITSSRVIYAYSRDGALPGSKIWARVHPWTKTPVYAGATHIKELR